MARRIDDLHALDWDDSALIKAYNKGMSLQVRELEEENNSKERKESSRKSKWKIGDFCRAVYPHDNLEYEAKIVDLNGETCIVDFLGYDEEVEVDIETLSKSRGKQARKKQVKEAKDTASTNADESASASGDDYCNNTESHHHGRNDSHFNHTVDNSANCTAHEASYQHAVYPVANHCTSMQSAPAMAPLPPPPPPMLHNSGMVQDPSMCAMLSSWYMAGYYTGLHQGQKNQCHSRCCHASQNCCH